MNAVKPVIFSLVVMVVMNALPAFGADAGQWIGARNCRAASLSSAVVDNVSWSGACKDGYAEGAGTLAWTEGGELPAHFEGTLVHGLAEGSGYLKTAALTQYEGGYHEGRREGTGVQLDLDGGRYDGSWRQGSYDGAGSKVYATGGRYDGQWQDGVRHGRGKATYLDGRVFEGEFRDGVLAGEAPPAKPDRKLRYGLYPDRFRSPYEGNASFPPDKTYQQMTREQQEIIREHYLLVHAGDEPPYPLRGWKAIWSTIGDLQNKVLANGVLRMNVLVDSDGNASSVQVYSSPNAIRHQNRHHGRDAREIQTRQVRRQALRDDVPLLLTLSAGLTCETGSTTP